MKLASIVSSLLAGGLVFGSAFSSADGPGRAPAPPAPSAAPRAPKAPKATTGSKASKASKIRIKIEGADAVIDEAIGQALEAIRDNDAIPRGVRDDIAKRIDRVGKKLRARVAAGVLDADALEELGEELGREMEGFGEGMEKWGETFGKQLQRRFGGFDADDLDIDLDIDIDLDDDDDDLDDAIRDLGSMKLSPAQRGQIRKLRADSDARVATAKRELDRLSEQLRRQLEDPAASEAEIARSIDAVTRQEAAIRKARILAWVKARRILDASQRAQVEAAAKSRTK